MSPMQPSFLRKLLTLRSRSVGKTVTPQSGSHRELHPSLDFSTVSGDTSVPATNRLNAKDPMTGNSLFSFVDLKDPFTPSEIVGGRSARPDSVANGRETI